MQKRPKTSTPWRILFSLFVLSIATALVLLSDNFQTEAVSKSGEGLSVRTTSQDENYPNYDIRTEKSQANALEYYRQTAGKNSALVADIRDNFVRGEDALRARYDEVKFEYNADIRTPEVITPDVWKDRLQYLSSPSSEKRADILRDLC